MTHPEDLHRTLAVRPDRAWTVALAALGILVVAGLLTLRFGRPLWNTLKSWRATQFLSQSEDLLSQGQTSLALQRARSALQLVPDRPDALRANARLLASVGSEMSLGLWQRLLDTGAATPADHQACIETAVGFDRPEWVAPLVERLESQPVTDPGAHRALALYFHRRQQSTPALDHAREAHRLAPDNPTNTLLLASLLLEASAPSGLTAPDHDNARRLLWSVARDSPQLRIEALSRLVRPAPTPREDREAAVTFLSAIDPRSDAENVLLAETRLLLQPQDSASIISNLVAGLRREDWDQLALVVDCLLRLGHPEEVLHLTSAGRTYRNRPLFLARYQALRRQAQFEEAYRHLLQGAAPLPAFDLALLRVRAAQEANHGNRRDEHLAELLAAANDLPFRLRRVALLAEAAASRDADAVAVEAWKRIARHPREALDALDHLQHLADRAGDTWTARDHARRAARLPNGNTPQRRLEIAHYSLLLDEDLDAARAETEAQLQVRTNEFYVRAVAALAHLKSGQPDLARHVLDRTVVPTEELRTDALAILAATFGANGMDSRARSILDGIPLARLRPEEKDLLKPWLLPAPNGDPALP